MTEIRSLTADDSAWEEAALRRAWRGTEVARKGELINALELDGFAALDDLQPVGLLTYAVVGDELEVVTLQAEREGEGIGQALMDAARDRAEKLGLRRMWLVTTNNNVRAIRFYLRWGMDLAALHRDAVARSRLVKPSIPLTDVDGVAIRHELEFELVLSGGTA